MTALEDFHKRLAAEWLPSFCEARRERRFFPDGLRWETVARLSEFDARWFLAAVDAQLVSEAGGFFRAPKSRTNEQIFWSGSTTEVRRSFTLWLEPIITIGALARLNSRFGWPGDRMGCQSEDYAVDLICYDSNNHVAVAGEIKKTGRELDRLLTDMGAFAIDPSSAAPPPGVPKRNAWKKVAFIRKCWPSLFWAVGPEGLEHVFGISREDDSGRFALTPITERALHFQSG